MTLHQDVEAQLRASEIVTVVTDLQATLRQSQSLIDRPLCRIRTVALVRTPVGLRPRIELTLAWRRAGSNASDATLEDTLRAIVADVYSVDDALPDLEDISIEYGVDPAPREGFPTGAVFDVALLYVTAAPGPA